MTQVKLTRTQYIYLCTTHLVEDYVCNQYSTIEEVCKMIDECADKGLTVRECVRRVVIRFDITSKTDAPILHLVETAIK